MTISPTSQDDWTVISGVEQLIAENQKMKEDLKDDIELEENRGRALIVEISDIAFAILLNARDAVAYRHLAAIRDETIERRLIEKLAARRSSIPVESKSVDWIGEVKGVWGKVVDKAVETGVAIDQKTDEFFNSFLGDPAG